MARLVIALEVVPRHLKILVPSNYGTLHKFMSQLLYLAKVPTNRLYHYDILPLELGEKQVGCPRVEVSELHIIDWHSQSLDPRQDTQHLAPRFALRKLRGFMWGRLPPKRSALNTLPPILVRRKIALYVQRSKADDRRVGNEKEIIQMFASQAEDRIRLKVFSDSPVPPMLEAVKLFRAAHVVLGMHGAGLSNAVFCQEGTHLIEFALPEPGTHCYAHLAMAMELKYWQVAVEGQGAHGNRYSNVSLASLQSVLSQIPEVQTGF
eukprot:CAMPEP_0184295900 /NCGR_PEP_ID=MMETSP1049-20130417/6832_1 /TAXON_ID=77928 /ORGANISM="Proteomonas sulcata, Strain CCMP704" /LENGTH=263 /DNA_ID=CAMNT_0026604755 /DNA_START=225 /DNA_END=1016 /DNA_ORIENTATION=+